ncbi:MAG: CHAP domain-containing protein [Candidatus Saccharimonadales bacterium]
MLPSLPGKLGRRSKRKMFRWGLILGNSLLLVAVTAFIFTNRSASQTIRSSTLNSATTTASSVTNPLDRLSSAQIALSAAQLTRVPELTAIKNQADSDTLLLSIVPNDSTTLSKPQIVATAQKSKADIIIYEAQAGDSVASLAEKFGVSADSIRWSNDLTGNFVAAGRSLRVPPVNGIVYEVKAGDTPASLARKYQSIESQIVTYNDAEIRGLKVGELIIIPNGRLTPVITFSSFVAFSPSSSGYNGYDYGYCTWYVANKISVPNNWGNASTWDNYARLSGWTVSILPRAGAIAQRDGGLGHVGLVEAVSDDGLMIKYSDMNGLAGWNRVGRTVDWVPATKYHHYIYR